MKCTLAITGMINKLFEKVARITVTKKDIQKTNQIIGIFRLLLQSR